LELDAINAHQWLSARGIVTCDLRCEELGGGVSNRVILAETPAFRAVLKQSLGKLRVEHEWLSDRARIFREAAAMRWLQGSVKGGHVPALLFEDRPEFAISMEAAPSGAAMWKTRIFAGDVSPVPAQAAGTMLGSIIAASWNHPEARELFGDQTVFDQLRIDPYYRFTATRHPELKNYFYGLIEESAARRVSLVHGDWSPKNMLVAENELWAIDWEVVHFGDPSFDVGFLLNHLVLKSIALPALKQALAGLANEFIRALNAELPPGAEWIAGAALVHLPALLLARVDGKSPAEYLDESGRNRARKLAISFMTDPAASVAEAFNR
jgi:5-methylthioribose kinase